MKVKKMVTQFEIVLAEFTGQLKIEASGVRVRRGKEGEIRIGYLNNFESSLKERKINFRKDHKSYVFISMVPPEL